MFAEEGNKACELGARDKQLHYSRQLVDKSMAFFGIRTGKCVDPYHTGALRCHNHTILLRMGSST